MAKATKRFRPPDFAEQVSVFGPVPLLKGEDDAAYYQLLKSVTSTIKAKNIFEEIWLRDFTDITWEVFRLRRAKTVLVESGVPVALEHALLPAFHRKDEPWYPQELTELVGKWAAGNSAAISKVEKLMASAKVTMDMIVHTAFVNAIEKIELIDRLITIAENRRNAILHEIERHRASFVEVLRKGILDVEDVEFQSLEPKAISLNASEKNAA